MLRIHVAIAIHRDRQVVIGLVIITICNIQAILIQAIMMIGNTVNHTTSYQQLRRHSSGLYMRTGVAMKLLL